MCALDDSLTEIDWLNSLCINKKSDIKEDNIETVTISTNSIFVTPQNSPNETINNSRCNGYEKPSYSYAYLIKLAIESSKNKRMKLNEIYSWIIETFPYYKYMQIDNNKGWKNAIRHNLSLNKIFKRCAKDPSHLGKGSYWMIDPENDDDIQYPPVKKAKFSLTTPESMKSIQITPTINTVCNSTDGTGSIETSQSTDISHTIPIICTVLSPSHSNQNTVISPTMTSVPTISSPQFGTVPMKFPLLFPYFSNFTSDNGKESRSRTFLTDSVFSQYSNEQAVHSSLVETSDTSQYSCEISYNKPTFSNCTLLTKSSKSELENCVIPTKCANGIPNKSICCSSKKLDSCTSLKDLSSKHKLEVDEDMMKSRSAKDDFILKTPVLSQINSIPEDTSSLNIDLKEMFDDHTMMKLSIPANGFTILTQDTTEAPFDNLSLYDSFVSVQHPLFDSESRSFELSQSTRKYLFNLSGVKENLLNRSQWLDLQENEDLQCQCSCDPSCDSPKSNDIFNNTEEDQCFKCSSPEVSPTKEYLELKSSLINYRYKSNAAGSNQLSVSTSSTEKSSNTLRSKSDPLDNASEFENLKQDCTCDADDEINDFFPWESII